MVKKGVKSIVFYTNAQKQSRLKYTKVYKC